MDVMIIVTVGFGSAILGAAAAFLGQKYLADREFKRRRVGLLRALMGELQQNGTAVTSSILTGADVVNHTSKTWEEFRVELGQFLPPNLYEDVDFIYLLTPSIVEQSKNGNQTAIDMWSNRLQIVRKQLRGLPEAKEFRSRYDDMDDAIEAADAQLNETKDETSTR